MNFLSSIPRQNLKTIQHGAMNNSWRGVHMAKNPFDLALYQRLLWELKPRTIIEIGTKAGGSALWFENQCEAMNIEPLIISVDKMHEKLSKYVKEKSTVVFVLGYAGNLRKPLWDIDDIEGFYPKPWLITEDSSHNYEDSLAVLQFFSPLMTPDDYIVIEDGIADSLGTNVQKKYNGGPNRAIREHLAADPTLKVDHNYCCFFGENVTWAPNGWLRKVKA